MEEVRYMISEAAKKVDVETHVLRYWQKELALPIHRNEMKQRYYKESDIELLKKVRNLKEQGFQLKAIKMLISNLNIQDTPNSGTEGQLMDGQGDKVIELFRMDKFPEKEEGTSLITKDEGHEIKEETGTKMGQFKTIMNRIILDALKENNGQLTQQINTNVTGGIIREMNYLMKLQEDKEEERFKKFDSTLREYQKGRMMTAATIDKSRKKSKFFKKNKVYL